MNSKIPEYVIDSKRKEQFEEEIKYRWQMKVAVVDIPTILKFLQKIYVNKDIMAQQAWQIIEDLCKEYKNVIVPSNAFFEILHASDESRSQILKNLSKEYKVIIEDYSVNDITIFDFAKNVSKEFKCPVDVIRYDLDDVDYNNNSNKQVKYTVIAL